MEIKEYTDWESSEILDLYASVGWSAYTDYPDTLKAGFEHSLLILAAYEDEKLLGIIRAVGDGYTIVYVQDILVHPAYQRRGIGSALLQAVLSRFEHVRQIVLSTDDTAKTIAFYKSQGFVPMAQIGCCSLMKA